MTKIAFAAIVKGSDEEAVGLNALLASVVDHVDAIFITITQPNEAVKDVAKAYDAIISDFEWVGDFSAARNFNFAQVPEEYDYIMWGDADDTFTGLEDLHGVIEENTADAYLLNYLYDFDEYGVPNVVHAKTMVVRNDGSFEWKGRLHEDLDSNKDISAFLIEGIQRIHHPTEERVKQSAERNLGITMTEDESDPRTWWNRSNAYLSLGKNDEAMSALLKFVGVSQSKQEKYLAYNRMSALSREYGEISKAKEYAENAIALYYNYPDAYFTLGEALLKEKKYYESRDSILEGLRKVANGVPTQSYIVYNPRDYDYNPLMLLGKCYWEMGRPQETLKCLEHAKQIQPKNTGLDKMIQTAQEETDMLGIAEKAVEKLGKYKKKDAAKKFLDSLPEKVRQHPIVMHWVNNEFIKEESSGKDVAYFCGISHEEWNPDSVKTGIGGSEEAVILLTKEWANKGYNVTVYTNCGKEKVYDGVTWKPWYMYNPRNKYDITVMWRQLQTLDHEINSDKIYVDLHDTIKPGEFTKRRLEKIDKIFVKSLAHRRLYPKVHSDKFTIVPNPLDNVLFDESVERDPFLLVNTSSPERSLEAVCRIFRKVKEVEPRAKMKWAYGWKGFDAFRDGDKSSAQWKKSIKEYMDVTGIDDLGRISHEEVAKLYKEAKVFFYPTKFYEIDCISARKAQIAGAHVVSSNFAALDETVIHGRKIDVDTFPEMWHSNGRNEFGDDEENDDKYVDAILEAFLDDEEKKLDPETYSPKSIASLWTDVWEQ